MVFAVTFESLLLAILILEIFFKFAPKLSVKDTPDTEPVVFNVNLYDCFHVFVLLS